MKLPERWIGAAQSGVETRAVPKASGTFVHFCHSGGYPRKAKMIAQDIELEMRLIEDLLNVARIHLGKLGMAFEIADAYALLHSALGIWANEIADKNLAVQLDLQACEYCLPADSGRLQQVFWNLLKNAVKFTPPDCKVTLRLDLLHGTNLEAERQVDRSGRQVIELQHVA